MEDTTVLNFLIAIISIIGIIVFFVMASNIGGIKREITLIRKILEKYALRDQIVKLKNKPKEPQS